MAVRLRNWETLSANYRKRLERAGITKTDYESGVSLEKARGHEETPEHPERLPPEQPGAKDDKYKKYRDKIKRTIDYIQEFKEARWSTPTGNKNWTWNAARSKMNVRKDQGTGKARGIKDLQIIKAMVDTAIKDHWLTWHGIVALDYEHENAFYYH